LCGEQGVRSCVDGVEKMEEFEGRVAVVTGSASGIGRGIATVLAGARMKVVLADVEETALLATEQAFLKAGHDVHAVLTDVSDRESVMALAEAAKSRYGPVHVLCNNAGVGGATGGAPGIWNAPPESWQWVMGVNFMGVVHGLQAFVPDMVSHGEPGHIVNTSSVVGVWFGDGSIYSVSKHAVTALTEGLFQDLKRQESMIHTSLLLPALTATRINTGARNRPEELKPGGKDLSPEVAGFMQRMEDHYMRDGMDPVQVGEIVLDAIRQQRFYVFTHPDTETPVERRMRGMLENTEPVPGPMGRR
jgi:NAD(P)-dependent dehydrogenase (short-subunit alcohol dehydrogenase family)